MDKLLVIFLVFLSIGFSSCQQEEPDQKVVYSNDVYQLKEYKVERHPPVVRNGFAMDIYHEGNASLDTMYLRSDRLPAWHPNYPYADGYVIRRCNMETADSVYFKYDLLFYNEFAYAQSYSGDYNGTGFPVIFMYADPTNDDNSTKALMVGQGIDYFNAFTSDSITSSRIENLKSDPLVDLSLFRTELHTSTVDGFVTLRSDIEPFYQTLLIGNKFRPNIGGVFDVSDVSDDDQINYQPVFLIKTREGLYAKFMVTRFKGVGVDTQKLTLQWQALNQ